MLGPGPWYYSGRARVIHRYRRHWLLVAAAVLALLAPAAVAAVEPEPVGDAPNLVFETVLTVRYVDSVSLLPVAGASVRVHAASSVHGDIGDYEGTTNADGVAVLSDLPFEAGIGPAVTLDVAADYETMFVDDESGCSFIDSWHAERAAVAANERAVEVEFAADEQQALSSIDCPPTEPAPTGQVGGVVGTPKAPPKATLPSTDTLSAAASAGGSLALPAAGGLVAIAVGLLLAVPRPRRAAKASVRVRTRR